MYRVQTEDRKDLFDEKLRKNILKKSDSKCCKCGAILSAHNMTIDHYIPLAKGGTNAFKNLYPLCYDCNQEKSDKVYDPSLYIKYIDPKYKNELNKLYSDFVNDVKWYSPTNLTIEDATVITYPLNLNSLYGHKKKGNLTPLVGSAVLEKANYSDLDEIYEFTLKYMEKYELDTDSLKDIISEVFRFGCLYTLKNKNGMICVIPIQIEKTWVGLPEGIDAKECYVYEIKGCPMIYQNDRYDYLLYKAFEYIFDNLAHLNSRHFAVFEVQYPTKDTFLQTFFEDYKMSKSSSSDDGWSSVLCGACFDTDEEAEANGDTKVRELDEIMLFSENMERLFNLPSLNKKQEDFDITKMNSSKEKKEARQYRKKQKVTNSIQKSNQNYKRKKAKSRDEDRIKEMRDYL